MSDVMEVVQSEMRDGIVILRISNPPANSLTLDVRKALIAALDEAEADSGGQAMVIAAEGSNFSSGAALSEYTKHAEQPTAGDLASRVEKSSKLVVAALQGAAVGPGFELALACHKRLVSAHARLGLPDLKVGVTPAAGGTQRLCRLVGAKAALRLLISAHPITAGMARQIALIDAVVEDDVIGAAVEMAKRSVAQSEPLRRSCDVQDGLHAPKDYLAEVKQRRAALADDPREAVHRLVDLVEAALLMPFEVGLTMETAAYEELVEGNQARALRHSFQAERRTVRRGDLGNVARNTIGRVGLVGGGRMGRQIAKACLNSGVAVVLIERDDETASTVSETERDRRLNRLIVGSRMSDLSGVHLVLEAVNEDLEIKRQLFADLGSVLPEGMMVASCTDSIDLDLLAEAYGRPQDLFGLRFFAPADRNRLVEVLRPPRAAEDLAPAAARFVRALGRTLILPGPGAPGMVLPVFAAMLEAAEGLVLAGATPAVIDAEMVKFGFERGPYRICDSIGLDLALAWSALGPSGQKSALITRLLEKSGKGEASGLGFYRYDSTPGGETPAGEATALAAQLRKDAGTTPRDVSTDEIQLRLVLAMSNAGAKLIDSGGARLPADIDAAMLIGFGFPRWEGGPMEAADQAGLDVVRAQLKDWAAEGDAPLWQPAAIFDELIRDGRKFGDLNL
ncbi:MAG: enoyl-CoA hydratase-related protein [Maritimibacter sp.]